MTKQSVCIVTGGSAGIGAAICQKFLAQGYRVYNLDIQAGDISHDAYTYKLCDVADCAQVSRCIEDIASSHEGVDVLVSNAGVHYSATIEQTSEEALERIFAINVKGAFAAIKGVLPSMKARGSGTIILMASDQALVAKHNSFAYNLSKAALASMAKTTALDYASYGIRANAICPGTIETPLYHQAIDRYVESSGADKAQVHAAEEAMQPIGRLGKAEEVAALAYFLASPDAAFITGSLQVIDGGYTCQ